MFVSVASAPSDAREVWASVSRDDEELAALVQRITKAAQALISGDIEGYVARIKHAHDYTLMSPYGGDPVRGFDDSDRALDAHRRGRRLPTVRLVTRELVGVPNIRDVSNPLGRRTRMNMRRRFGLALTLTALLALAAERRDQRRKHQVRLCGGSHRHRRPHRHLRGGRPEAVRRRRLPARRRDDIVLGTCGEQQGSMRTFPTATVALSPEARVGSPGRLPSCWTCRRSSPVNPCFASSTRA